VKTDARSVLRQSLAIDERTGDARDSLANVMSVLSLDPEWQGVLAFDAFKEAPVLLRPPPQRRQDRVPVAAPGADWTEQDSTRTATWIADIYGANVSSRSVTEAMMAIAQRRTVHPPRSYVDGLRWDRVARLDLFFPTYCGSPAGDYSAGVARILFLSAIARLRKPGCKVDTIVILESVQGGLKSSLVDALFSPWASDTPLPLGDKDAYQQLRGVWGYEIAELASFKGRDATRIKSFASSPADNYRPSFERRSRSVPRQCIFIGTTNEDQYLDDATGARRFPPVKVPRIDIDAIRRDRDQLWAEADVRFKAGEPWWPTKDFEGQIATHTEERYVGDPWEDRIRTWLAKPVRLHVEKEGTTTEALDARHGFTMAVVLELAVRLPIERQDKHAQDRAQKILKRAGWRRGKQERVDGAVIRRWFGPGDTPGDGPGDREKQP
jgi:putative DNA primase/helicase